MAFFKESSLLSKPPKAKLPQCGKCGLYKKCESPKMKVVGSGRKKILIVGEAPGFTEDESNGKHQGKTSIYLERVLEEYGIDMLRDCWITYALICKPPKGFNVTEDYIEYCNPNLTNVLKDKKPFVIITVGRTATEAVLKGIWTEPVGSMQRWAGYTIPCRALNAWVCPVFSPSFIEHQVEMNKSGTPIEMIFNRHIKQVSKLIEAPYKDNEPDVKKHITIIEKPNEAAPYLVKWTKSLKPIAFDYETNMLKPDKNHMFDGKSMSYIQTASVCWNGKKTIAFPMLGRDTLMAWDNLMKSKCPKIAHNLKFEDRWTRGTQRIFDKTENGGYQQPKPLYMKVNNWVWDTMNMAHVIDNRKEICSLSFQSFVHLGVAPYGDNIGPFFNAKGSYDVNRIKDIEMEDLLMYNGLDSWCTFKLAKIQMKQLGVHL